MPPLENAAKLRRALQEIAERQNSPQLQGLCGPTKPPSSSHSTPGPVNEWPHTGSPASTSPAQQPQPQSSRNSLAIANGVFVPAREITLDLPVPPSVNSTRRLNHRSLGRVEEWKRQADLMVMASGQYQAARPFAPVNRFEIEFTLCERRCRMDADNVLKAAIDYLRRIELIRDDGPRQMRKVTVTWGDAPNGCRIVVRPLP